MVLLLGLGGFIAWTGRQLENATVQQAERDMQLQAHVVAGVLGDAFEDVSDPRRSGTAQLASLVTNYARTIGVRVVVVDAHLQPVALSDQGLPVDNLSRAPEVISALQGQSAHDRRRDTTTGEEILFGAAPIAEEGHRPQGVVQLSRPMASLNAEIRGLWLRLLSAGSIVLLGTVLVSVALARRLARPIQELTTKSVQLAAGDLRQRVRPAGPDEIRQLGETFNQMVSRLEQMLATQRAFVAYAAHELRSPLASMRLRIEMLQTSRAQHDRELVHRYIDQVERDLEHLSQLVDQLLTLSALDEAERSPFAAIDLAPLLYEVADDVAPAALAADLVWRVDVPDHLPEVQGNATQLRMAVRNLLENAIKYTHRGGTVTIAAQSDPAELRISVTDTGIGMTAEQVAHIFDRFYRADEGGTPQGTGFGLGLAIVQAIVTAHNGRIEVSSEHGKGSTFTLHLPTSNHIHLDRPSDEPHSHA